MEEIVGKPRLFREPLGGQVIGIALRRYLFYRDKSFFNEVPDVGVDKAECDAEMAAQIPLGKGVVVGQFIKDLERSVLFCPRGGEIIHVHIMNIPCSAAACQAVSCCLFAGISVTPIHC